MWRRRVFDLMYFGVGFFGLEGERVLSICYVSVRC